MLWAKKIHTEPMKGFDTEHELADWSCLQNSDISMPITPKYSFYHSEKLKKANFVFMQVAASQI